MPEVITDHPQPEKLAARFTEFNQAQQSVISGLTEGKERTEILASVPLDYQPIVSGSIDRFRQTEERIKQWQKDNGLTGIPGLLGIKTKEAIVKRVNGGVVITLPVEDFVSFLGLKYYQDGKLVTDQVKIKNLCLNHLPEAGFLLEASEIPENSLPSGMQVAVVADNLGLDKAIIHEEQEIVGKYFDQAMETDPAVKKLQAMAVSAVGENFDHPTVRLAIYDLAARLENGQTEFNLASLGITPDYAKDHQEETSLLKIIIDQVNQNSADRHHLANLIRGGALRPENLVTYLSKQPYSRKLIETDSADFAGVTLKTEKKGRFVYNQATLNPNDPENNFVDLNGVKYTVRRIIGKGGFGVVYEAAGPDGKKVAIKEFIISAPQALFASYYSAAGFFDGLTAGQKLANADPFKVLADLKQIVKPQPEDNYSSQNEFGQAYIAYLDNCLQTELTKNERLKPVAKNYKNGEASFSLYDPKTGAPVRYDEATKAELLKVLRTAVIRFPLLTAQSASKLPIYSLIKDFLPENMVKALDENIALFDAEGQTLPALQGIEGVASSLGTVRSSFKFTEGHPRFNCYYMVQEFAEGQKLSEFLKTTTWTLQQKVDFVAELLTILQKVHDKGVVHKDIKPDNIHVTADGRPIILDFGIAKAHFDRLNLVAGRGTTMMGTEGYASPEHLTGKTDPRSDLYSVGMLLYEIVIGEDIISSLSRFNPLDFQGRIAHIDKQLSERKNADGSLVCPAELKAIILKAIAQDPVNRYQNAAEMEKALKSHQYIEKEDYLDQLIKTMKKRPILPGSGIETYYNIPYWRDGEIRDPKSLNKTDYRLPPEFDSFFKEIGQLADKYPLKLTTYLQKLALVSKDKWDYTIQDNVQKAAALIAIGIGNEAVRKGKSLSQTEIGLISETARVSPDGINPLWALLDRIADIDSTKIIICSQELMKIVDSDPNNFINYDFVLKSIEKHIGDGSILDRTTVEELLKMGFALVIKRPILPGSGIETYYNIPYWRDGEIRDPKSVNKTDYRLPPAYATYLRILRQLGTRALYQPMVTSQLEALKKIPANDTTSENLQRAIDLIEKEITGKRTDVVY